MDTGVSGVQSQTVGDRHRMYRAIGSNHPLTRLKGYCFVITHRGRWMAWISRMASEKSSLQASDALRRSFRYRQFESTCRRKPSNYLGKIIRHFQTTFLGVCTGCVDKFCSNQSPSTGCWVIVTTMDKYT